MGKGKETSVTISGTVMATYAPPDLFLIHSMACARYASDSWARLAAMAACPSSDCRYLWKKASQPTEREPRSAAGSKTSSCTRWPCCHVAGPRSHKQRGLTCRAAFPSSDCAYCWKKASQPTEREPRSAAGSKTLAVLHDGRAARRPCCTVNVRGSQTARIDLSFGLYTRQLAFGFCWTDVVRWFIGATCGVHACHLDSFPAALFPAPFAFALRRHLWCTDKRQSPKLPNDQTQEDDQQCGACALRRATQNASCW